MTLEEYSTLHTSPEGQPLENLVRETNLKVLMPRMLSGHTQGKWLEIMCRMINATCVLEIGTFTGYSAICLAKGIADNGTVYTIDNNAELKHYLPKYAKQANVEHKIVQIIGDASEEISKLNHTFDLVYIDADKENYSNYYNTILPHLRKGGIIIADNVLWSGKVVQPLKSNDRSTAAILAFNTLVQQDPRVENVLLPIRDGIMMAIKLTD